ncbi:BLUF domain-containing protein [Hymenobacter sp. UYP22]|uniref:BLUF domain-containing protein n=1 Tax=Hymenobacter sp. UYP22 TaxID=3156348 RepID=UPI003399BF44
MPLHHLIYLSTPTIAFTPPQLRELLRECRANNANHELTGVLFYGKQHFMQLIEGEKQEVHALYHHLQFDTRHNNLIKIADKPIQARAFADWSMAFQCLDAGTAEAGMQELESVVLSLPALAAADALLLETVRQRLLAE